MAREFQKQIETIMRWLKHILIDRETVSNQPSTPTIRGKQGYRLDWTP